VTKLERYSVVLREFVDIEGGRGANDRFSGGSGFLNDDRGVYRASESSEAFAKRGDTLHCEQVNVGFGDWRRIGLVKLIDATQ
jgi:hypothetical protein